MRKFAAVLMIMGILGCAQTAAAQDPAEAVKEKAIATAEQWLELVDLGQYEASWENAADLFKQAVTKDEWIVAVERARSPMGRVLSRRVESASYETSLPGAPDGEYVVIQYVTSFENKESAVETITPVRDNDNTWRVSGYYIR